jgi:hypothetical protein
LPEDAWVNASRIAEVGALAFIAFLVATGGRILLHALGNFRVAAALVLVVLLVTAFMNALRTYRAAGPDARAAITRSVAYMVAGALALADVLVPAKWIPGSCIAAAEVALAFDIITVVTRKRAIREH